MSRAPLLVALAFITAAAAHAATPPVYVAGTPPARMNEPDWRVIVGINRDSLGPVRTLAGVPNYKCVAFDNGCPPGTRVIDADGNLVGCSATCTGECKVCSGSVLPVSLCVRSPGVSCTISTTTSVSCGKVGRSLCFSAPPGAPADNRGCWCTVPSIYTDEICKVRDCIVID
jgi:hypothetical protein